MSTETETYAFQLEWLQQIANDLEMLHKLPQVAHQIRQARTGLELNIEVLRKLLINLCGKDNHLSHCDRMMGTTHPCTCGTRRAYRLIHGLPLDEAIPEVCHVVEYDGAFKCLTHRKMWGAVSKPDTPCEGWET